MKNSRDLILGEVVYIPIIYRIQDSRLNSLNDYGFSFDQLIDENRELIFFLFLSHGIEDRSQTSNSLDCCCCAIKFDPPHVSYQ